VSGSQIRILDIQPTPSELLREDISEYVAQLQLHMALQARNLLPSLNNTSVNNSRQQMLQETQAIAEKFASRQSL
jgi:23S rRNA pseudoU1915 N3-methylase RlmH